MSDSETYTNRIVEAVADECDSDVLDLPPLYHSIDPEALESVLDRPGRDTGTSHRKVQFYYAGYLVTVDGDGEITLQSEAHVHVEQE